MSLRRKIELLCDGFALSPSASEALPGYRFGAKTVRDYPTTTGLIIRLPDGHYVNVRVQVDKTPRYVLDRCDEGYRLVAGDDAVPVDVFPPSDYAFANRRLPGGTRIRAVANTHADRVRLTPIYGCGMACAFCNFAGMEYVTTSVDDVQTGLEVALGDRIIAPPHVLVSGGSPRRTERDYRYLNEMYRELPARFPALRFDAMLAPRALHIGPETSRKYANFVRFLKQSRYQALSINLEFNNELTLRRHARSKYEIGRAAYMQFLAHAVEIFGRGEVRSMLIVGLEDDDETLKAVEDLAARGVLVELSPFNAFKGSQLHLQPEPGPDRLEALYYKAREIAERYDAPFDYFCVPCSHNIL